MIRTALLLAVALPLAAPAAAAPVKLSLEANYRLGYDINPFLTNGNDLAAPYVQTSLAPKISKTTSKGVTSLTGHFDRTGYFKNYGKSDEYGAELESQQRLTSKLSVFGALRYSSDVIGQNDDSVSASPIDNIDVNLIGLRQRSNIYSASGGWQYQISPKDTITGDGGYTATRYADGPINADSDNIGGRLGWQHAINARSKVGISGSVYRIDYDTPGLSTLIMEPAVTFSTELSAKWHFDASVGMSFSDLHLPGGGNDLHSKGLSGTINLCHKGLKDDFCFFASRDVSASGLGGTTQRTQAGYNYSRRLTERLIFTAGGAYARSESQASAFGTRQFVSGRGGLDYRVNDIIRVGAEGRYRDVFGGPPIKADFGGDVHATVALTSR